MPHYVLVFGATFSLLPSSLPPLSTTPTAPHTARISSNPAITPPLSDHDCEAEPAVRVPVIPDGLRVVEPDDDVLSGGVVRGSLCGAAMDAARGTDVC